MITNLCKLMNCQQYRDLNGPSLAWFFKSESLMVYSVDGSRVEAVITKDLEGPDAGFATIVTGSYLPFALWTSVTPSWNCS